MTAWHILGAGSMGCLWASLLRERDNEVTLFLRDRGTAAQYRDAGAITIERDGMLRRHECAIETACEAEPWNIEAKPTSLIVSTKAYDTVAALDGIRDLLPLYEAVVLLQNGMGTVDEIRTAFPDLAIFVGVTSHGAWRRSRFHVVHAGRGPTWIGRGTGAAARLAESRIASLLGLDCPMHFDEDILRRMWIKLTINCVINGMTVVHDCRNGEIVSERHVSRVVALSEEARQVLCAWLPAPHDFDVLDEVTRVAVATRENVSSMLQDVRGGKRTEVEYINGFLCRAADAKGIAVPQHRTLLDEIRARTA